jgi:type II secretory pathway component GspD/PulD (secretin)
VFKMEDHAFWRWFCSPALDRQRSNQSLRLEENMRFLRLNNMVGFAENLGSGGEGEAQNLSERPAATLHLNFRNAPLQTVLNYLHDQADLTIEVEPNVEIQRTIELCNPEPVDKQEALKLLRQALAETGYTAVRKGSMLAVVRSHEAKKYNIPLPTLGCAAVAE